MDDPRVRVTVAQPDPLKERDEHLQRINAIVSQQLGIGIDGQDPTNNITSASIHRSGAFARNVYKNLDVVSRIIDSPAEDALRSGFTLKTNFDDLGLPEMIQKRLTELKFTQQAFKYLRDTRLYDRGGLMHPVIKQRVMDSGRLFLTQPIIKWDIERVVKLNVVPDEMFTFTVQNQDPFAVDFDEINRMMVMGKDLSFDRFIHHINGLDLQTMRGVSVLDKIEVACKGLAIAEWTIQNLLLRYRSLLIKYPRAEAAQKTPRKQKALLKLMDAIKLTFSSKSVASMPDNYSFEILETKLTGLKEGTDFLYSHLASVSNVPQSIIKGSAQGELASAEKDQRDYYEYVQSSEQQRKVKPLLDYIIPFLLWESEGEIRKKLNAHGIRPDTVVVDITFNPLQSVNPMQDAQINFIEAQTAQVKIQNRIITSEQAQEMLHPELEKLVQDIEKDTNQFANMDMEGLGKFLNQFPALSGVS